MESKESNYATIECVKGNIFDAPVEALVNPVNCKGVMGAGLAKQFKEKFPFIMEPYREICRHGKLKLEYVHLCPTNFGTFPRWIINFPTKYHWNDKAHIEVIELTLHALVGAIGSQEIRSIAIPPLGCGLGGLDWADVKPLIVDTLKDIQDLRVMLYEPT